MLFLMALLLWQEPADVSFTSGKERIEGFYDLCWDEEEGNLYLGIDRFDETFLMVNWLATGLGSNDIGLDRGQLGQTRLVAFKRVGKRVFLVEPNLMYRAETENEAERNAVRESFTYSTLWGTDIVAEEAGHAWVNLKDLAFQDHQGVMDRLRARQEGSFSIDKSRSHYMPGIMKSFPDNTEVEIALTFTGKPQGRYLPTVAPSPESFTLRQRLSLIRLPDDGYKPRAFNPASGGFVMRYRDYAAPLEGELDRRMLVRHRLVRKQPGAAKSELVEPLVYYVDRGAPPAIKQALIEGASWWAEAFEAAGIVNGYRVEEMPADMDPMDVRYNVIQWVHRSTRGWSYGASVVDPRTGEIIKGHVTLGSLRVRQDRLLFEGMIPRDENGQWPAEAGRNPTQLALARIRQLSAHEIGHTLGAGHNFAASSYDRASVMDYPAPLVTLENGQLKFDKVYDRGIGEWDKLMVRYLYGEFENEAEGLAQILREGEERGLFYLADQDGRSMSTLHPEASVWDNGADAVAEMARMMEVRQHLLANLGPNNLAQDKPLSRLEEVLTPAYLHHRFQIAACAKSIGGAWYDYNAYDGQPNMKPVVPSEQIKAIDLILATLDPAFLDLPSQLQGLIPPRANGYPPTREDFGRRTGRAFDEFALPETSVALTLDVLLDVTRINRLYNQHLANPEQPGSEMLLEKLLAATLFAPERSGRAGAIHRMVNYQTINSLTQLLGNTRLREDIRAHLFATLEDVKEQLEESETENAQYRSQHQWLVFKLDNLDEQESLIAPTRDLPLPPGSPIGQDGH